jgi:hypothetical protein
MPADREVFERPFAGRSLGDCNVAGLNRAENAAAIQERVGGFVRIGVTLDNVALEVLQLSVKVDLELGPGRRQDELGRLSAIQVRVSAGKPVRSIDRP